MIRFVYPWRPCCCLPRGDAGFAEQDGVGAFYWVDGDLAYALIGNLDRSLLDRAADAIYQQLNP